MVWGQGIKLELFIFDTFPLAENVALLEVRRDEEFAPVKNAPGSAADSPDTARAAILALHQRQVPTVVLNTGMHCIAENKQRSSLIAVASVAAGHWSSDRQDTAGWALVRNCQQGWKWGQVVMAQGCMGAGGKHSVMLGTPRQPEDLWLHPVAFSSDGADALLAWRPQLTGALDDANL